MFHAQIVFLCMAFSFHLLLEYFWVSTFQETVWSHLKVLSLSSLSCTDYEKKETTENIENEEDGKFCFSQYFLEPGLLRLKGEIRAKLER